MDKQIRELERQCDSEDLQNRIAFIIAKARSGSNDHCLEILNDLQLWDAAPDYLQDIAIKVVGDKFSDQLKYQRTKKYTCGNQKRRIATFIAEFNMELNLIPAGHINCLNKRIQQPLFVGRFPVACKEANCDFYFKDYNFRYPSFSGMPVICDYVKALNFLGRRKPSLRLPTEEEWVYACEAGSTTAFPWGEKIDNQYIWHNYNAGTMKGVSKHKNHGNAFGLVDMLGNCWEWTYSDPALSSATIYGGDYTIPITVFQKKLWPNIKKAVRKDGLHYDTFNAREQYCHYGFRAFLNVF